MEVDKLLGTPKSAAYTGIVALVGLIILVGTLLVAQSNAIPLLMATVFVLGVSIFALVRVLRNGPISQDTLVTIWTAVVAGSGFATFVLLVGLFRVC